MINNSSKNNKKNELLLHKATQITEDFVLLTNTYPLQSTGVLLDDTLMNDSVTIYALNQLKINRVYKTQRNNRLERINVNTCMLGDNKTLITFDPTIITKGISIIDVLAGAHQLNEDDDSISSRLAKIAHQLATFLQFKSTQEMFQSSNDSINVKLCSEVGELSRTIAGAHMKISHLPNELNKQLQEDDNANDNNNSNDNDNANNDNNNNKTTLKIILKIDLKEKVKTIDIGRISGALKLFCDNIIVKQINEMFPSFISYFIKYEKSIHQFHIGCIFKPSIITSIDLKLLKMFDFNIAFGSNNSNNNENESDISIENAAAIVNFQIGIDSSVLKFIESLFECSNIEVLVQKYIDIILLIKEFAVTLKFKDFTQLSSTKHQLANSILEAYGDSYSLIKTMLETLEYRFQHTVSSLFRDHQPSEQTKKMYEKNVQLIQKCFESINCIELQYDSLDACIQFQGLHVFDRLPALKEINQMIAEENVEETIVIQESKNNNNQLYGVDIEDAYNFIKETSQDNVLNNIYNGPSFDAIHSWEILVSSQSKQITVWIGVSKNKHYPPPVRIEAIFPNVKVAEAFEVWYNYDIRRSWDEYLTDYQLIESKNNNSFRVFLSTFWVPPGISKRDFVEYQQLHQFDNGNCCVLGQSTVRSDCPPRPNHLRSRTIRGGVTWEQIGNDCRIVVISHQILGGKLGPNMTRLLNRTGFFNWMSLYRKVTLQHVKRKEKLKQVNNDNNNNNSNKPKKRFLWFK